MTRALVCVLLVTTYFLPNARADENTERAVSVREANLYVSPDTSSQKLGVIERGREVAVLEHSGQQWLHVLASLGGEREVSGWVLDKGLVRKTTPNGDQILYGEAVDSESEASRRGGRRGSDKDALRLYYRVSEYFPNSPLAGQAAFRSADIAWPLDVEDIRSRSSARDRDPDLRHQLHEEQVRKF